MQNTLRIFKETVQKLLQAEADQPVAPFIPHDTLYSTLDIEIDDEGCQGEAFEKALSELVLHTPRTASRSFFNQLFGGRNEKAVLGDLLAVVLNNSMYTYKAAGPMIGMEKTMLRKVCDLLGWGEDALGTIATGGSMTNFMGMLMARDAALENMTKEGVRQPLAVYTSKESHYSIPKNASFAGIGRNQVRYIDTDNHGRMRADLLEQAIEKDKAEGILPIMVNATAGTTVLGAFDPFAAIAKLCKQHNIWFHVDGAYCGSVIFSTKYKPLIAGAEHADSFTLNAHKMLGTPLTCSLIVVQDKKHLYHSFSNEASYLYQTHFDDFNPGKISLQCGRRNDALKLWTLWKQVGTKGLGRIVEHQFALADAARAYIRSNPDYTLYSFDNSVGVCFNYKDVSPEKLCNLLYEKEQLMVGYGSFKETVFVRFVTINAQNKVEQIHTFFSTLETFVEEHYEELTKAEEA